MCEACFSSAMIAIAGAASGGGLTAVLMSLSPTNKGPRTKSQRELLLAKLGLRQQHKLKTDTPE